MTRKTCLPLLLGFAVAILGSPAFAGPRGEAPADPLARGPQVITSMIGDYDCFGYGAPTGRKTDGCGTLPGLPIADSDAPDTDVVVDCSVSDTITFTHTLDIPVGATILGGAAVVNVGGIDKSEFNTVITADGIPGAVPDTGALGTALVVIPLLGSATSQLNDGQVVVTIRHGLSGIPQPKCNPMFVDFSSVSVLVHVP
jgi:hypothetical protein